MMELESERIVLSPITDLFSIPLPAWVALVDQLPPHAVVALCFKRKTSHHSHTTIVRLPQIQPSASILKHKTPHRLRHMESVAVVTLPFQPRALTILILHLLIVEHRQQQTLQDTRSISNIAREKRPPPTLLPSQKEGLVHNYRR